MDKNELFIDENRNLCYGQINYNIYPEYMTDETLNYYLDLKKGLDELSKGQGNVGIYLESYESEVIVEDLSYETIECLLENGSAEITADLPEMEEGDKIYVNEDLAERLIKEFKEKKQSQTQKVRWLKFKKIKIKSKLKLFILYYYFFLLSETFFLSFSLKLFFNNISV